MTPGQGEIEACLGRSGIKVRFDRSIAHSCIPLISQARDACLGRAHIKDRLGHSIIDSIALAQSTFFLSRATGHGYWIGGAWSAKVFPLWDGSWKSRPVHVRGCARRGDSSADVQVQDNRARTRDQVKTLCTVESRFSSFFEVHHIHLVVLLRILGLLI